MKAEGLGYGKLELAESGSLTMVSSQSQVVERREGLM